MQLAWWLAVSVVSQAPVPPPPSTGQERAVSREALPEQADAKKDWERLLMAALAPNRDCSRLIGPRTRVAFTLADSSLSDVKSHLNAYLAMARCAEKAKYFILMAELSQRMHAADPGPQSHPELAVRAALGLGATRRAVDISDRLEKELPDDGDVALTAAKAHCRIRDWDGCEKRAQHAVALAGHLKGAEQDALMSRAQKYSARATLHQGKLEEANLAALMVDLANGDPDDGEALRDALVPARTFGLIVETEVSPYLALGVYHLSGKLPGSRPPATFYLTNIGEDRQVRVEAGIEGVTSNATRTVTLQKGKSATVELTPPFLASFDPASVRATRKVALHRKVVILGAGQEKVAFEDTADVLLEPRDFLPLTASLDAEYQQRQYGALGAWVTPNVRPVDAFLAEAKKKAPRNTFSGEQSATLPQVKALYETLQAHGVSYVMDPNVLSGLGFGQRTRLPAEVLASTNAQCLEGSLLYATLMEAIGLEAAVVVVPGHAFVAWRPSQGDQMEQPLLFLETTMTHDAPFESAVKVADAEFRRAHANRHETVVLVSDLRKAGFTPQPFD